MTKHHSSQLWEVSLLQFKSNFCYESSATIISASFQRKCQKHHVLAGGKLKDFQYGSWTGQNWFEKFTGDLVETPRLNSYRHNVEPVLTDSTVFHWTPYFKLSPTYSRCNLLYPIMQIDRKG